MIFFDLLSHEPLGLRRETLRVRVPRQTQMGQNLQRQWVETGTCSGRVSALGTVQVMQGNQGWHFLNWGNSRSCCWVSFVVNPISIPNRGLHITWAAGSTVTPRRLSGPSLIRLLGCQGIPGELSWVICWYFLSVAERKSVLLLK